MVIHTHLLASITKPPITHSSTVTVNSLSPTLANHLPLHFHCVLSHFHPSYLHPQIPAVETTTTKKTFGRKSKTDLHGLSIDMFFCGCDALSNAFELHFCSYKHVFQRFTSFVGCDWRSFKNNCFQQRLIFYKTPVNCHQCLLRSCTAGWML